MDASALKAPVGLTPDRDLLDELDVRFDASDKRMQAILDHAPIVIAWFDPEGRLLFANREFERVRGVGRGELRGRRRAEFLSPESAVVLERNDQEVLAAGVSLMFEESTADSNGAHDYLSVKFPLCDPEGVAYAVCSASFDVTGRKQADVELARLAAIVAAANDAIVSIDMDGRVTSWNAGAEALLGYSVAEMLGNDPSVLMPETTPEGNCSVLDRVLAGESIGSLKTQWIDKTGSLKDVAVTAFPLIGPDGQQPGAAAIMRDIGESARQARALAASEQRYREILERTPDGVLRIDLENRVDYVNAPMAEMLGFAKAELLGLPIGELIHPTERQTTEKNIAYDRAHMVGRVVERRMRRQEGQPWWARISTTSLSDAEGNYSGTLAVLSDITEAKNHEANLRSSERFVAAIADSMTEGMFALDRDGNLAYMNRAAERMLGWTAEELEGRQVHEAIHDLRKDGSARPVEECPLVKAGQTGVPLKVEDDVFVRRGGELLPVAYSVSPLQDDAPGAVVVFRDIAESKVEELRVARELEALAWVGRIRDALEEDRFVLYAQPILDLSTGAVTQHELLIRMVDRGGKVIAPTHFLPIAERYGLINEIDRWVIGQAAGLAASGNPVQFNLSGKSIAYAGLGEMIQAALYEHGADPASVICEITETALVDNAEQGEAFVRELNACGCRVALDDFGTGYGGFTYVKRLPVSYLKIDIEFVRDLVDNPASRHVVAAVVSLARGFGQKTIAEGVEDERALELLMEMGVDYAQGYAIGRPAPVREMLEPDAARAMGKASAAAGLADSVWRLAG